MQKYFLYCRKSSEAEDRQILSIGSQVIELKRFGAQKDIKILEVLTEAKSAKAPGVRPVFNSMMSRLYRGEADGVICWKLDRLARNPVDGGAIIWAMKQHVIKIVTPVQTFSQAEDNAVWMYLEFGMAQKYVDDLSRNVKRGLKTKAEMGWFPGPTPPGYLNRTNPDGRKTIAKDPKRFPIVRKCWELMLTGKYSASEVWNITNTVLGFKTVNGLPMTRSTMYRIFQSRFYMGQYEYPKASGTWHTGQHIPMVTAEEFTEVQRLIGRKQAWPTNRKTFALSGLIQCGTCERMVTAEEKHQIICSGCKFKFASMRRTVCPKCSLAIADMQDPLRLHYIYYHCSGQNRGFCSERSIRGEELLAQVDRILGETALPGSHEQWMLRHGKRPEDGVVRLMRAALKNSLPETQRQIVMAFATNMRLKGDRLSCDHLVPFRKISTVGDVPDLKPSVLGGDVSLLQKQIE